MPKNTVLIFFTTFWQIYCMIQYAWTIERAYFLTVKHARMLQFSHSSLLSERNLFQSTAAGHY